MLMIIIKYDTIINKRMGHILCNCSIFGKDNLYLEMFGCLMIIDMKRESVYFTVEKGTGVASWKPAYKKLEMLLNKVEVFSNRMSCLIFWCWWCSITVLNVHAPTEEDNVKNISFEESELNSQSICRYNTKFAVKFQW